ncbi:hypothetical protein [Aurantiacibacter hainanensis]|uniref:hypothetical protein n=1 Tax=Aurantiacibacter hainanensis TaxID=3076114 RepID=UPI0030C6E468
MTELIEKGHFFVGELPDGKFVAASNSSPYFCFRAQSEDDVLAKVDAALTYYYSVCGEKPAMQKRATATVNNWKNKRAVPFKEYAHAV